MVSTSIDFEGYKIYRATDFEFNDAYTITDGEGNLTFLEPYMQDGEKAQWDLENGKNRLAPNRSEWYQILPGG